MMNSSLIYQPLPFLFPHDAASQSKFLYFHNSPRVVIPNTETSKSDPFENMKFTKRKRPILRPILNKNKKSTSFDSLIKIRSDSTDLSPAYLKSTFLPSVFKSSQIENKNRLSGIQEIKRKKATTERNIETPYFRQNIQASSLERLEKIKYAEAQQSRSKFFDKIKHRKIEAEKMIETFEATLGSGFKNY